MRTRLMSCAAGLFVAAGAGLLGTSLAMGADVGLTQVGVTAGIGEAAVAKPGQKFYKVQFTLSYSGSGSVILSGNDDGTGGTLVDDIVTIKVKNKTFTHNYSQGICSLAFLPPQDITNLFSVGLNKVTVTMKDDPTCGGFVSSNPMWVTVQP